MRNHRFATVALGAIAVATLAAPANASSTVSVEVTAGIVLDITSAASWTCGFPIELRTVGREIHITRYDTDGVLRAETVVQVYDGELVNPANGRSVPSHVAGPVRDVYLDDGTIIETTSGATVRTAPGHGIVSGFIGHEQVTLVPTGEVDEDGSLVYDVADDSFSGMFLGNGGVCDLLR